MNTERATLLHPNGPDVSNGAVANLERQVERGSLFTHTALSELNERVTEVESMLHGIVNTLVGAGAVAAESVGEAVELARDELVENGPPPGPRVALRVDGEEAATERVFVDCASRLPICQAACCRLSFALSAEEVEGGVVKWDLGEPYQIRHEAGGYCTHCTSGDHACSIYSDRPSVCRTYSCANDTRIWTDFANRELNHEWIDSHLGPSRPRLARVEIRRRDE